MKNSKSGHYIVEATMVLPLVLLMILALGTFVKAEGSWERAFHCAADESARAAAMACDGVSGFTAGHRIKKRIAQDVPELSSYSVQGFLCGYHDLSMDQMASYTLKAGTDLRLPAGFDNAFQFSSRIKYRNFRGRKIAGDALGISGLENGLPEDPVWIFPRAGEKYHTGSCTYVKANVHQVTLNSHVRSKYAACAACHSETVASGSVVYCFSGDDTAYHRGSCPTIQRHTIVVDRTEARHKGYTPCSKCGGGKE